MRIERIVITGDVFRTSKGEPNQILNVRWLREELARLLYELTGLWPDIRYRHNAPDGGRAVVGEWYRLLGHAPSLEAWAATYGETDPPPALVAAMRPDYERALVVGFELSPLLRAVLTRIGCPWVDVEIGAIRFLADLALDFRFSWPVALSHPGLVLPENIRQAVARVRALHGRSAAHGAQAPDLGGACVFLAQTRHDRTLIKDGGFFSDAEALAGVAQALNGRRLVIKPHPLAPDNPLLRQLQCRFGASTTEANVYALLAAAADAHFLTISSSAAIEAQHFGHAPEVFHPAARNPYTPVTSLWAHRTARFWRAALQGMLPLKAGPEPDDADHGEATPDRLRRRLGSWGWPPDDARTKPASNAPRCES